MSTIEQIETWVKRVDAVTERAISEFGNLSAEHLNQKPNESMWSIAENLQHLILVNESYYPIIEKVREGNLKLGWMSHLGFIRKLFGTMILGSVEPTRKKKISTFPIWEPSSSCIEEGIVARFSAHQHYFIEFIRSCQDLLEKKQVIHSPANDNIVYSLEKAFEIIVTHEERHLAQALEAKSRIEA